jgi:hypothetical protein
MKLDLIKKILHIKTVKKCRNNWVGDWDYKKIMINKNLPESSQLAVIVHELIEMIVTLACDGYECCDKKYNQKKYGNLNELAHAFATLIEYQVMDFLEYRIDIHEESIEKLKNNE